MHDLIGQRLSPAPDAGCCAPSSYKIAERHRRRANLPDAMTLQAASSGPECFPTSSPPIPLSACPHNGGSDAKDNAQGDHRSPFSTTSEKRPALRNARANCCGFNDRADNVAQSNVDIIKAVWRGLGWTDRLLSVFIITAMILGVVIGKFANVEPLQLAGGLEGVSTPLVIGLLVMMWPILCKVQYEQFGRMFRTWQLWRQIALSVLLNWIIAPFLMLGLASATLPDLPSYRIGILLVGTARCIAMVMIWTSIAKGETDVCAILVILNSLLQIVAYAPLAVLQINVISGLGGFDLRYGQVAIAVLIYLGIPLVAGVVTRFGVMYLLGRKCFETSFLPRFSLLSLLALLYTIIIIFAEQAAHVLDNLGPTFRTVVPLVLYFATTWGATFAFMHFMARRHGPEKGWTYEMAVTQSLTTSSNNFELAVAVAIAAFGAGSDQALAATIGPLVEVPVLLLLSWVALFLGKKLGWSKRWSGGSLITSAETPTASTVAS